MKLNVTTALLAAACAVLAGCGTTPAPEFSGKWKPVNRFSDTPVEIPLNPAYTYYASPMDQTLKSLLTRWARDNKMQLDYRITSDYTLYGAVGAIRTTDLSEALAKLTAAYGRQGVIINSERGVILVRAASVVPPPPHAGPAPPPAH